jgi:phage shock protein PspC (stress-responsive transcriptional regulator)
MKQDDQGNLFMRDDTFFGVCEGLGEDLRIPSNLFRIAFALGFFFSMQATLITYLALGVLVLVSRLIFPRPRAARRAETQPVEIKPQAEPTLAKASADEQMDLDLLPIAA